MDETSNRRFSRILEAFRDGGEISEEDREWFADDVEEMNRHLPDFREDE